MLPSQKIPVFLTILLFLGAFSWLWYLKKNTGVPWDEPWEQALAQKSWDYATGKNEALLQVQNKYHGASFEAFTEAVSRNMDTYSYAEKLQTRRTVLVLFFLVGALFLFLSVKRLTRNYWLALLAVAILFFTPRIMLHAAVNTKDIPILSVAAFFLWASIRFWNTHSVWNALLSGLGAAVMISLRIPAVYVVLLWLFLWLFAWKKGEANLKKRGITVLAFAVSVCFFTYICWPILWGNPLLNFKNAWVFMSRYPWENEVLFRGQYISALSLPRSYIPVWMGITIPPVWSLLVCVGVLLAVFLLIKRKKESVIFLFLMGFVAVPILAVIVLKSVVYDEWRHVFFIYPAFILIAVYGIHQGLAYAKHPKLVIVPVLLLVGAQLGEVFYWSAQHPRYTYLYFNPLIRANTCGKFEQDYWGFSYKDANEFLISQFSGKSLPICYVHSPGKYNYWALPDTDKQKLALVPYDEAEYLITTHRFEKESFNFGKVVFEHRVNDCAIITVYKKEK